MEEVRELRQHPAGAADEAQRYVRITNTDHKGYVEFQFSIGDPHLFLEMTLPRAAFEAFCRTHAAVHLSDAEARAVDAQERKWRYGKDEED